MGWSVENLFKKNKVEEPSKAAEAIRQLQLSLFTAAPFYAEIMTQLNFVENKKIDTAATDGLTVYYNPDFLQKLSEGQRNYIILHELFHVILMHCLRDDGKDADIWNIAADCVVNCFVDQLGEELSPRGIPCRRPSKGCFLKFADNYSVDDLYRLMCLQGQSDQWVQQITLCFDEKQSDLIIRTSKEEQEQIRQLLEQYLEKAAEWGNEGCVATQRILNLMSARKRLPWKQLLRKMCVSAEEEDSSYLTPERKYLHMGLVVSGWGMYENVKLPDIWAFIDSSESISDEILSEFLSQLYVISKELGATLNIAYWDTRVTEVYKDIKKPKDIGKCTPQHTGATDVGCVYEYLRENKIDPEALIIFTDGYFEQIADRTVGKLKKKTIVIIDGEGIGTHKNLGKEARL